MRRRFDSRICKRRRQQGFTLVEAIVVIMITGIIAGTVAIFMRGAVQSYFDTSRRAEISDIADTAMRRMGRDIQGALPNSVRVSGNYLEFVPIVEAGRYRTEKGTAAADDPLDFSAADNAFDVLGPAVNVAAGDRIVIFNMGQPGASVYDATPANAYPTSSSGTVGKITFAMPVLFGYASPGNRFQVVRTAVSYVCDLANSRLMRYSGYAIQSAQPVSMSAAPLLGVTTAIMASNVTACSIAYASGALERNGLVTVRLSVTEQGESVHLMHQVNVVNTP